MEDCVSYSILASQLVEIMVGNSSSNFSTEAASLARVAMWSTVLSFTVITCSVWSWIFSKFLQLSTCFLSLENFLFRIEFNSTRAHQGLHVEESGNFFAWNQKKLLSKLVLFSFRVFYFQRIKWWIHGSVFFCVSNFLPSCCITLSPFYVECGLWNNLFADSWN
jgi:hypothetical protein